MAGNFFGGAFFNGGFFGALDVSVPQGRAAWLADYPRYRRKNKKELSAEREQFGIPDLEAIAIAEVARRQAQRLELDRQKQFEELSRELQLRRLALKTEYLQALNETREFLINAEIKRRIALMQDEKEVLMLLTLMAAAA